MPRICLQVLPAEWKKTKAVAGMIVYLMTPTNSIMSLLRKLLTAVESFYHPSNIGAWSKSLGDFLYKLIEQFVQRLHEEKKTDSRIPAELRLTEAMKREFVELVTPSLFLAQLSKNPVASMEEKIS